MADSKITNLAALTGANTAVGDLFEIVDISDTSMAATGTNKKTTAADISTFVQNQTKITTIASGSLPAATTLSMASIPATYAMLHLKIVGASSNTATRHPRVQIGHTTVSSTAADYTGVQFDGGGGVAGTLAAEANLAGNVTDQAAAATWDIDIWIAGYQGGPHMNWFYKCKNNVGAINYGLGVFIGVITALDIITILWNGTGNFDAGTYALYGVN